MEQQPLFIKKFHKQKKENKNKKVTQKKTNFLNLNAKTALSNKEYDLKKSLKSLPNITEENSIELADEIKDISNFLHLNNNLLGIVLRFLSQFTEIKSLDDLNSENFNDDLILYTYYKYISIDLTNETEDSKNKHKFDFLRYLILILNFRKK